MTLIDVRTKEEYDAGHLEGALLLDVQDIAQGALPDVSKDEPIILYCASGARSGVAKRILESAGFTNVTNGGGMREAMTGLKMGK